MTGWILWIALVLIAGAPVIAYLRRHPMDAVNAPGLFADLPGGRTHYQWHGPADGSIIVCVHGLTTPSYVWGALLPGLTRTGYRILTYDLYGRGYSDRVAGPQNAAFFNRQLEELLVDQGLGNKLLLLGYSMGGAIVSCYGARHPDRVTGLVLVAPAGLGLAQNRLHNFVTKVPIVGDWLMLVFGGWLLRKGVKSEAAIPSHVPDIYAQQTADTYVRGFLPAVLSSQRNLLARRLESEHLALAKSAIPVAAIWGEADAVIPISGRDKLAALNPATRQTTIQNAPHSLAYTHPQEVVKVIQDFLRDV